MRAVTGFSFAIRAATIAAAVALFSVPALLGVQVRCAHAVDEKRGPIEGRASVTDGDGVEIDGEKIRLYGIDAPEVGQYCTREDTTRWHCGQYATVELDRLIAGKPVVCDPRTLDSYGRWIAVCKTGDIDLGGHMVAQGWAVAYRRYSKDYVDLESAARGAKRGIWAGKFQMPWEWRAAMRGRH